MGTYKQIKKTQMNTQKHKPRLNTQKKRSA